MKPRTVLKQPYWPKSLAKQLLLLQHLLATAPTYYVELEVTTARQAKLTTALTWMIWGLLNYMTARQADAKAATTWRNNAFYGDVTAPDAMYVPPAPSEIVYPTDPATDPPFDGMGTWLFEEIARWKKADAYLPTTGDTLKIIGPAAPGRNPDDKPSLKLTDGPGATPQLNVVKKGYKSYRIMADIHDGKGLKHLDTSLLSKYVDILTTPPAAGTSMLITYCVIYQYKGKDYGQPSDKVDFTMKR